MTSSIFQQRRNSSSQALFISNSMETPFNLRGKDGVLVSPAAPALLHMRFGRRDTFFQNDILTLAQPSVSGSQCQLEDWPFRCGRASPGPNHQGSGRHLLLPGQPRVLTAGLQPHPVPAASEAWSSRSYSAVKDCPQQGVADLLCRRSGTQTRGVPATAEGERPQTHRKAGGMVFQ